MADDRAILDLKDASDYSIEEIPVMADNEHRALVADKGLLKSMLRGQVEMVGRLIKEQEICGLKQKFEDGYSRPLAT